MIRVLLVDDQPLVRTGIAMLLSAEPDMEVVGEVADGEHAIEQVRLLQPDVVLMDVRMPGLDGVEATKAIVDMAESDDVTKVLILTTYHVGEAVYAALRAGASGFLLKDAQPEELVAAIQSVAGGDAWLHPAVARELIADFAARPNPMRRTPEELSNLTPRESEVLLLLAHGLTTTGIAAQLVISEATVKTHLSRILMKLGVHDKTQAVVVAYQSGLAQPGNQ